ncbi:MAG TPA: hypothetical protein VGI93_02220, partial [Steroidobacteraceae bacterium]
MNYPKYLIDTNLDLVIVFKTKHKSGPEKGLFKVRLVKPRFGDDRKREPESDKDYRFWNVKNPKSGKVRWIVASRA